MIHQMEVIHVMRMRDEVVFFAGGYGVGPGLAAIFLQRSSKEVVYFN